MHRSSARKPQRAATKFLESVMSRILLTNSHITYDALQDLKGRTPIYRSVVVDGVEGRMAYSRLEYFVQGNIVLAFGRRESGKSPLPHAEIYAAGPPQISGADDTIDWAAYREEITRVDDFSRSPLLGFRKIVTVLEDDTFLSRINRGEPKMMSIFPADEGRATKLDHKVMYCSPESVESSFVEEVAEAVKRQYLL